MKSFCYNKSFLFFLLVLLTASMDAQVVISKPNLGFSQACASPTFNTYNVSFTFSPVDGLSGSNQFIVELSDASGNFDTPEVLFTSTAGSITSSPANIEFSFPTTIAGEAYRIRIKSTSPAATSSRSDAFAAYYKAQDTPFSINNLVGTAAFCSGGSYLLTIDNPGTNGNDSPLNYPELTFNWFKQTSETTSVFVAEGETLEVSEEGTYFVETNYGSCTSNSFSNRVTVSEAGSGTQTSISSSLGNPFCPDGSNFTTLTTILGQSYQWFKDGESIPNSNSQSIETDEPGEYSVNIDLGDCSTSAVIQLESEQFSSSIDVGATTFMEENETLNVTVTTDAINPLFTWYLNNSVVQESSDNSYLVTEFGSYRVVVSQTTGCAATEEFQFLIASAADVQNIPNVVSPNNDGMNDTWIIPQEYLSGTNTEIMILDSRGKLVYKTKDYANNWPLEPIEFKAVNPVFYYVITTANNTTRKGSITVIK